MFINPKYLRLQRNKNKTGFYLVLQNIFKLYFADVIPKKNYTGFQWKCRQSKEEEYIFGLNTNYNKIEYKLIGREDSNFNQTTNNTSKSKSKSKTKRHFNILYINIGGIILITEDFLKHEIWLGKAATQQRYDMECKYKKKTKERLFSSIIESM